MPARYVQITLEEFDEFMEGLFFERLDHRTLNYSEYVYERQFLNVDAKIRIYSSISIYGEESRGKGRDAIRVVVLYKFPSEFRGPLIWQAAKKQKRVHRVQNWRTNLDKRIEEARIIINVDPCSECGAPMILREGKYGLFYSCTTWPQCNNTCKANTT
jgi:hypothetical protein